MKWDEQKLVNEFKNEYRSTLYQKYRLRILKDKQEELINQFNAHSPSLENNPSTGKSHDERLAEYTDKKSKLDEEIKYLESKQARVDYIMSFMPKSFQTHMRKVYSGYYTLEHAALEEHMSEKMFRYTLDKYILQALIDSGKLF